MDWIIKKAAEKGLFIGLLPTWGDKVDKASGTGPVIFNKDTEYKYGQWIANRYKNYTNIFWIDGGDRNPDTTTIDIWVTKNPVVRSQDLSEEIGPMYPAQGR